MQFTQYQNTNSKLLEKTKCFYR